MIEINSYYLYNTFKNMWDFFWEQLGTTLTSNGFSTAQFFLFLAFFLFWKYNFIPMSKAIKEIKDSFSNLHNAGLEMQNHLGKGKKGRLDPIHKLDRLSWAVSHSPFQLNDMGENLYKSSGLEDVIKRYGDRLLKKMYENKPSTGYDVEKCSFHAIEEFVLSEKEIETNIKNFIYKNPVFEGKEVGLGDIFFVGSIKLRDMYFEKHPETNTGDEKEGENGLVKN